VNENPSSEITIERIILPQSVLSLLLRRSLVPAMNRFKLGAAIGLLAFICSPLAPIGCAPEKPNVKFTALDGRDMDLAKLKGKVVLIDFWATWCGPCVAEVPNVVDTYNRFHDKGFEIIGISLDHDKDALAGFIRDHGMVWPQYFDGKGWDNDIARKHGVRSIPAMWLVDKEGNITTKNGRSGLAGQVEKLLSK
jgi:thiol-disulfide isomerase/thioredoxin